MNLKAKLASQIGDDVQCIFDHEALFKLALEKIRALELLVNEAATTVETAGPDSDGVANKIRKALKNLEL